MRTGLLKTTVWLEQQVAAGKIRPYREADLSTRMSFQDMDPNDPIWVDPEEEDGWQVTYMRANDMDGAPDVKNWYAECINEEGEAKGFMATVDGDDWTPTHGDHAEYEAEQEALGLDDLAGLAAAGNLPGVAGWEPEPVAVKPEAVPGMAFAGGGQVAPVLRAIGKSIGEGDYRICFYYQIPNGGRAASMPSWEIPAKGWDHMQATVRAFNGD